jgi:hypothetical protein
VIVQVEKTKAMTTCSDVSYFYCCVTNEKGRKMVKTDQVVVSFLSKNDEE